MTQTGIVGDNNSNGRLDPGERAGIIAFLGNLGNRPATNVLATLRTASPYVIIADSLCRFGTVYARDSADNGSDPFKVMASLSTPPGTVADFTLVVAAAETTWTFNFSITIGLAPGTIVWGSKPLPAFPPAGFAHGVAYDPVADQILVLDAYGRSVHIYSSDTLLTYLGAIAAPDTCLCDISYCDYDDRLWVTGWALKNIWKISKANGTIFGQFANPARDCPSGLAWNGNRLWLADRRTALGATQLLYVSDTLGFAARYNSPIQGHYSSRCLAYDRTGNTFVQTQTWYDSTGTARDSAGVVEYRGEPPASTGNRFRLFSSWNVRGIEYDPRDGSYWITIPQVGGSSVSRIAKVAGFHGGIVEDEEVAARTLNRAKSLTVRPNPARSYLLLSLQIPTHQVAEVRVCDASGRLVAKLFKVEVTGQGDHEQRWDLRDERGCKVAPGVYFIILETTAINIAKKVVVTY